MAAGRQGGRSGPGRTRVSTPTPRFPRARRPPRPGSGSPEGRGFRGFPPRREKSCSSHAGRSGGFLSTRRVPAAPREPGGRGAAAASESGSPWEEEEEEATPLWPEGGDRGEEPCATRWLPSSLRSHGAGGRLPGGGRRPGRVAAGGAPRGAGIALRGQPGREAPGGPALHQGGAARAHRRPPHPVRQGGAAGEALCRPEQASGRRVQLRPPLRRDGPHQAEAALQDPAQAHHHQRGQEGVRALPPPAHLPASGSVAASPGHGGQAVEGARPPDLPTGAGTVPPERAGPALCGNPMNCFCSRFMQQRGHPGVAPLSQGPGFVGPRPG